MSEEDRIELKKELSVYSKEELLEKYIDELEENIILTDQWYKSSQRINNAIEYIEKRRQEREKANKYAYDIRNDDFIKYCNIELDILKGSDKE